jgi:Rap guanine nucleotide exchange factor 1
MIKKQAQKSPHTPGLSRHASLNEHGNSNKRRSTIVRADSFKKALHVPPDDNNSGTLKPAKIQNRDVEEFERYHKDVKSAVKYFRIVVEKKIVSKVPDNITILLESVIHIDGMLDSCLKLQASAGLGEMRKTMQSCISKLVKWGDDVLIKSATSLDIEKGLNHLNALEKSIQELHDSAIPRLQKASLNRQIRDSVLLLQPEDVLSTTKADQVVKTKLSKSHSDGSLKTVLENGKNGALSAEENRRDSGISERSAYSDNSTTSESPPVSTHFTDSGTCLSITSVEENPLALQAWHDEPPSSPMPMSPTPPRPTSSTREATYSSSSTASISSRSVTKSSSYQQTTKTTEWSMKTEKVTHYVQESQQMHHNFFNSNESRTESLSSFGSSTLDRGSTDLSDSQSIEELDEVPEMIGARSIVKQAQYVGSSENGTSSKKKAFQVYIQVLGEYKKPTDEFLERTMSVNSVYDNYQDMRNYTVEKMANALGEISGTTLITAKIPLNQKQPLSPTSDSRKTKSLDYRSLPKMKIKSPAKEDEKLAPPDLAMTHATSESSLSSSGDEECTPPLDSLDVGKFLVFREEASGSILYGGVADALIVHATNSSKKDFVFSEAFITTYRAFITPFELISRLIYRGHRMKEKQHKRASHNAFLLLLRVIDDLVAPIPKNILDMLVKETHNLFSNGQLMLGKWVRDRIIPKSEMHYHMDSITFTTAESLDKHCSIFSFHSEDLAKQLTIQDAQYYSRIEIPEILSWGKAQNEDLAPNLAAFTEHFNQVSYWCRTYILSFEKVHDREKVYAKFLKTMKFLRRFNNFNSLLAIYSALDCSAIRRLEFPKVSTDSLAQFSSLIESEGSFRIYRKALAEAKPPCIPYLGLILQDVTFTYMGNKDELPDGKVNFYKCWQLFQMLEEFKKFRISKYEFERDPKIMAFFGGFQNYLSEDELYNRSLELKPRAS